MNLKLWDRQRRSTSSIAISVAFHVVAIAGLMTITFRYPEIFSRPAKVEPVAVRFIPLARKPASSTGRAQDRQEPRNRPPQVAAVPMPSSIPVGIPAPPPPVAANPGASAIGAGGDPGAGAGRDPAVGMGIRPGIPDGRLANPLGIPRAPETEGQKAERALAAIYQVYLDSARAAMNNPQRKPGDWSWGGKDGDKWGWDQNGIHVAGVTIPNIVLAALPMNVAPSASPVDTRSRDFMRSDIQMHAGLMTEDEFRAAVRRVRERVDRERSERLARQKDKNPPPP